MFKRKVTEQLYYGKSKNAHFFYFQAIYKL